MSRTVRRKQGHGWCYGHYDVNSALRKHIRIEPGYWTWIFINPKSKEGKRRIAHYHSDADTVTKYGPAWFITMQQRAYRRNAKQDIHKYFKDDEYEIQIRTKPKLEYWW